MSNPQNVKHVLGPLTPVLDEFIPLLRERAMEFITAQPPEVNGEANPNDIFDLIDEVEATLNEIAREVVVIAFITGSLVPPPELEEEEESGEEERMGYAMTIIGDPACCHEIVREAISGDMGRCSMG